MKSQSLLELDNPGGPVLYDIFILNMVLAGGVDYSASENMDSYIMAHMPALRLIVIKTGIDVKPYSMNDDFVRQMMWLGGIFIS